MDGKHVGNLFLGQFLFEDEPLDYELFRDQARRYGFDEQEYIAAYERVPRWSREKVDALISFYMKLAELISKLSHGNIKLARTLTERDRFMESLRESESRYRNLIENAPDVIYSLAEDGSITSLNPAFERITGWSCSEWLGKPFMTLIHPSDLPLAIESFKQSLGGKKQPPYELRVLSKSGEYLVGEFTSTPLMEKGKVKGEFGIARDITERKQAEEKLKDTLESLRKAVNTTIQVMVAAVETRDPYTAGHQIRSANLARAIATEMGLPQEKIDAIRMAGSIHDIGKLSIPAEILSKPTKLSEIEFSLIKEHARRGFEMLKDVESLWPLAEIVHQHHERMDGSGYPGNLKGDAILIEARILAVADVAEAMASHRPYRPGMGIDAALNEIEKNRGILYDNAVADACLRLFREKGFKLEGT